MSVNVSPWFALPALLVAAIAAGADVRTRRIPNLLTGPALLLALVAHLRIEGPAGLWSSMLGLLVAGGALLPGWWMGWMGAGDVKLMAAVGAWLGYPHGAVAMLASLIAGGIIALFVSARRGVVKQALRGALGLAAAWMNRHGGMPTKPATTTGVRFPFAVAVLAGALATTWIPI